MAAIATELRAGVGFAIQSCSGELISIRRSSGPGQLRALTGCSFFSEVLGMEPRDWHAEQVLCR